MKPRVGDTMELLDRDMARKNLEGHWRVGLERSAPHPETTVVPCLWKWADIYGSLVRAGEVVGLDRAERRTVRLTNPALTDRHATSQTIQCSFQYVKPGEHARPHRHSAAAFRFVLRGRGAYTTVNGQKCVMGEGDLILTPQLSWHDHTNDSDKPILWLDGLDIPLVQSLHQYVFESHPEPAQRIQKKSEDIALLYGYARTATASGEFFHYRWPETERALRAVVEDADPDRFEGYLVEFRNPVTGGPSLPTIQCATALLQPGQETAAHRHTSTVIYHVFRGSGASYVGNQRFDWGEGDSFIVPLWTPHRHVNSSASKEAILFSMSDAPTLRALDLYREEASGW